MSQQPYQQDPNANQQYSGNSGQQQEVQQQQQSQQQQQQIQSSYQYQQTTPTQYFAQIGQPSGQQFPQQQQWNQNFGQNQQFILNNGQPPQSPGMTMFQGTSSFPQMTMQPSVNQLFNSTNMNSTFNQQQQQRQPTIQQQFNQKNMNSIPQTLISTNMNSITQPFPPPQQRPPTISNIQQQQFEAEIQDKEQTINDLKKQLNKYKSAQEECLSEKDKLKRGENNLNIEINQKDNQISTQKSKINQQQIRIEELEQEIRRIRREYDDKEINSSYQIKNQKIEIDDLKYANKQLQELIQTLQQNINNNNNNSKTEMDSLQVLRKQNQELNEKLSKKNQEISEIQQNYQKDKTELESRYVQAMQINQKENEDLQKIKNYEEELQLMNRKLANMQQKMKEVQCSADNLQILLAQKEQAIQKQKSENEMIKDELVVVKQKQELYEKQISKITQNILAEKNLGSVQEDQNSFQEELNRLEQANKRRFQDQQEQRRKQQEEDKKKKEEIIRFKQESQKLRKVNQKKQGQMLAKAMMETHGKIQVCFVVDVTGSMDEYKETTMKCIQGTMNNIKQQTNRDTIWATVAYQDFGELQKLGNKYFQHPFTEEQKRIYDYLDKIKCDGGDDGAEDVRGGLKQMVNDLDWNKNFKMAILICDAPSHGAKWAGNVLDDHPKEDLSDALLKLIENKIMLIGVIFDVRTRIMFKEMEKFYKDQDKSEYLIVVEMQKMDHEQIKDALIKLISEASVQLTHTKNAATHTKQNAKPKSNEGAMEALCKTGINPMNFDQQKDIKITPCEFTIFRVEIKEDAFENKIEDIFSIQLPNNFKQDPKDFNITEEGKWKCIRTAQPYAFGQMKAVFLMRKEQSRDEVYVIKMPIGDNTYSSLEEALAECRSHLISKRLMSKFMAELKQYQHDKKSPLEIADIVYSDFLILKESENSFWIAERYFEGNFVKFNNNYGFISDEPNTLNRLAQTYSYYTYFTSGFNYVVNDVQGVGQYFTDPAINTQLGNFDETDIGADGIAMYMVSLQKYKYLIKDYIQLLELELD